MDESQLLDGFRGEAFATLPCLDGGGSIARYPLFDGVNALLACKRMALRSCVISTISWRLISAHRGALKASFPCANRLC